MSISRFVSHNIGSILVSDQITLSGYNLTANEGQLYINNNCINSMSSDTTIANLTLTGNFNGQNLQLTSDTILLNGNIIGTSNTGGTVNYTPNPLEPVQSFGQVGGNFAYYYTSTGNVISNTSLFYYDGEYWGGSGGTNGGWIGTDNGSTGIYIGDDYLNIGSNNNNGTSIFYNLEQLLFNSQGTILSTGNLTINSNVNVDTACNMTIGSTIIDNTYPNFGIIRTDDVYCTRIRTNSTNGILVHDSLTLSGNIVVADNSLGATLGNLCVSDINAGNGTFGNLNVTGTMTYENFSATNISTSSVYVYHPASTSDQDPMGNSSFNLIGQGGGGAVVNVDFSTYTTNNCPTARISMIDDGSFASTFNIMSKQSGSPTNGMVSRILVEPVNGYVGINNTTPNCQLDVNGTARFSGDVLFNSNISTNTLETTGATVSNLLVTGSIITPIIYIGQQSTNGNYIITKEMSGTTFFINKYPNDNGYIYLPTPSGGLNFKFIQANPETNWTPICVPEQNLMIGQINVTGTQGSSYANTSTPILDVDFSPSSVIGDTINIVSDGFYYYYTGNSFNIDGFNKLWQ
jgi:hypothetical protein